MRRIAIIALLIIGIIHLKSNAQNSEEAYLLRFKADSDVLYEHYSNNAFELKQLHLMINKHQQDILSNKGHLHIIACIEPDKAGNSLVLNQRALQASTVRAWIRTHGKGFKQLSCAFSFSITPSSKAEIIVKYINAPIDNKSVNEIYYTKDKTNEIAVKRAIARYGVIPFCSSQEKILSAQRNEKVAEQYPKTNMVGYNSIPDFIIYFRLNKSVIDPSYMNNKAVLNQMNRIITPFNVAYIDSLIISAYASPEAPSQYNKKLSEKRANSVRNYFLKQFPMLKPNTVHAYGHGENWGDLKRMAEDDAQLPMRNEVLQIINSRFSEDEREKKLKALKAGSVYQYIYRNYFPKLRLGASLNVMLSKDAPDYLKSLVYGPKFEPLSIKIDTLTILPQSLPPVYFPHYATPLYEYRYYRPVAIKTNLLFDAATLLNVEAEVPLGKKFSLMAEWTFPFWGGLGNRGGVAPLPAYSEKYTLQMLSGGLEARYWLPRSTSLDNRAQQWGDYNPLNGWFVGLYGGAGVYDFQWNGRGMQGEFYIASGISAGYAHPIGKYFHMEYSIGVGYLSTEYYNYTAKDGHKVVDIRSDGSFDRRRQSYIGPTKLKVSLIWIPRFKTLKKKGEVK